MRILHLQSFLSIRIVATFAALACLVFALGLSNARAESSNQQVERAWGNLRTTACTNARSTKATARSASNQHKKMEQLLREAQASENVPENVLRDATRTMQAALRDMGSIARDVRGISRDMERICSEDIVLRNIREAARKYDDRREDINSAAKRFNSLRNEYTEAVKDFNEAATDLAIHGSTLNQLETE